MGVQKNSKQENSGDEIRHPSVSEHDRWCAVLTYDACVRLYLNSSAEGYFLKEACSQLREAFGLRNVLLQPEEELFTKVTKQSSELVSGAAAPKSKKSIRKMEVQVCKVKMGSDPPPGSNPSSSRQTTLRSNSTAYKVVPGKMYSCSLRLKSSSEEDVIRMFPGSSVTVVLLPVDLNDDLIVKVHNSKEQYCGQAQAQVSDADNPSKRLQWWPLYREPQHKIVGKVQLDIHYSTSQEDLKCGSVAETVAYDFLLKTAMKVQNVSQRKLSLDGNWKWLVNEFASYYGVTDAYAKLRYLSYVMDVATPTNYFLALVHNFLSLVKGKKKHELSWQENRILGEIEKQVQEILIKVFKNYKSLDESSPSGMMDAFKAATGSPPPALVPAVKLYKLLHDMSSPETRKKFCGYFQAAAGERSRRHHAETDEFINKEGALMDPSYRKMKLLISSIRNEIFTDMEIQNQNILPSFTELPNLSAPIYCMHLFCRLKEFLVARPPPGPTPSVLKLVTATADFQRDLSSWNINPVTPVNEGIEAKELFYSYISDWIAEERRSLLVKVSSGIKREPTTGPFIDGMYDQLKKTLNKYKMLIDRWPEFTITLENAIADVEEAIINALKRQYADVLAPPKGGFAPKFFGKSSEGTYIVPNELGVPLNSMERILYVLHSEIESEFKSWRSRTSSSGTAIPGERLKRITVMLGDDFRNYIKAIVEKLAKNTRAQFATKLKKIIQDKKKTDIESDISSRMC